MTRFTHGGARVVQCVRCRLLYTDPPISGQYYGAIRRPDWFVEARAAAASRMNVYLGHVRAVDGLNTRGAQWRVLDVGCGMGGFLCAAAAYGYDGYGIEASSEQAAWAQGLHLNVRHSDAVEAFDPLRFQAVTLWEVLEHIARPAEMLARVREVLLPGGYLLLSVPNGPHALWKAKLLRRVRRAAGDAVGVGEHVVHYSAATLRMVLASTGYEVLSVGSGPTGAFGGAAGSLKRAGMETLIGLGRLIGAPLGATLLAIARRPADGDGGPEGARTG